MTLKDFNKKNLLKMSTAVKTTKQLHELAVKNGTEYCDEKIARFKRLGSKHYCPLCGFSAAISKEINNSEACAVCPWFVFVGDRCNMHNFNRSPEAITRLNRWLDLINTEISTRSKK